MVIAGTLQVAEENEETFELSLARQRERRRGLRLGQSRPVKVFEPRTARYLAGITLDVSRTGLRLSLPSSAPVVEGLVLTVHVGLSSEGQTLANRRSMVPARIVWVERRPTSRQMTCGVEFVPTLTGHIEAA